MAGLLGRARDEDRERLLADQQAALAALTARLDRWEGSAGGRDEEEARSRERCAALEARLDAAEAELGRIRSALSAADARLARMEQQADGLLPLLTAALVRRLEGEADGGELPDVPTALGRLDRQLKAYMADTDRTMRALVDRLEGLRRERD